MLTQPKVDTSRAERQSCHGAPLLNSTLLLSSHRHIDGQSQPPYPRKVDCLGRKGVLLSFSGSLTAFSCSSGANCKTTALTDLKYLEERALGLHGTLGVHRLSCK